MLNNNEWYFKGQKPSLRKLPLELKPYKFQEIKLELKDKQKKEQIDL